MTYVMAELDRVMEDMDEIRQYDSRMNTRRRLKLLLADVFKDGRQGHG